jgi:hypothetical protein
MWINLTLRRVSTFTTTIKRMPSSGIWHRVELVCTVVWEEHITSILRVEQSACEEPNCSHLLTLVPRWWIFLPWRLRRYVTPKRWLTQDLHGATSQKTAFFIVTALKTSNLTWYWGVSLKLSDKIRLWLQPDNDRGHFTRRPARVSPCISSKTR